MRSARRWRRITALSVGGAFLLAALAVLILWATAPRESATDAAQEYLDTIASGDIERANERVPAVPELGRPATVDGRTTAATAGWTPISQPRVVDSFETVEGVQVEVSYVVDDSAHTASLSVIPEENGGAFAEGWQVRTPLSLGISVDSTEDALPFTIGELVVEAGRDAKVTLYPGSYQVTFEGGDYLAGEEYTLDVVPTSNGEAARIQVMPELTPALTDELADHVADDVARCTTHDDSYLPGCQAGVNLGGDGIAFEPVTWTLVDGPTLTEDSRTGLAELRTTLRAEYDVADGHDLPRTPVTEEIVLRTRLMLSFESADSYQIMDVDWHTMPTGS